MTPRAAFLVAVLETGALFGLLAWLYAAVVAAFRPELLAHVVASWVPLRRDTFGIAGFVVSALSFLVLDLRDELPRARGSRHAR